jgi:DNA-binding sugar fermentation-stimulating protein
VYTSSAKPYERTAIFPHGAHKAAVGVVSDRAIKHVHELTQMHLAGEARCAVMFVVNRGDCTAFRPCHEADNLFSQVREQGTSISRCRSCAPSHQVCCHRC